VSPAYAALGCGVGGAQDASLEGQKGGDLDDLASPLRDHHPRRCLGQEEQGLQIDLDHIVPLLLAIVQRRLAMDDAGVVDEDVEPAELADGAVDHLVQLGDRCGAEVAGQRQKVPAEGGDLGLGLFKAGAIGAGNVGARLREGMRHGLPEAASGAGHQRHFACQAERIQDTHAVDTIAHSARSVEWPMGPVSGLLEEQGCDRIAARSHQPCTGRVGLLFTIGAFAILFDEQGRVLLCHRRDLDAWNLLGGGVASGELPTEAVVREVREEAVERFRIGCIPGHGSAWRSWQGCP
jgi:hypothetical protein